MKAQKILITGANGQLGTALGTALRAKYGNGSIITSDLTQTANDSAVHEILDATDETRLADIVKKYHITQIYHLAAVLSANGEKDPFTTWDINLKSLLTVLKIATDHGLDKVFFPSSIAVYGQNVRRWSAPQNSALHPTTAYGMSKVAGENWALYYFTKHGLDVRSLRYPGIIGHQSLPGGGTTDYAVDIYHKAIEGRPFVCYLNEDTVLPMIYMDDAVRATLELMEAPKSEIGIRTSYNVQALSFTPKEIAASIQKYRPDFTISYEPDFRQKIAESWPHSVDDRAAREDWEWSADYFLDDMTEDMLDRLGKNYKGKIEPICPMS